MPKDRSVSCHDGPISDPVDKSDVSTIEEPERRSALCVQLPREPMKKGRSGFKSCKTE